MGCDLVVALGKATASGHSLFGLNSHRLFQESQALVVEPARSYALGELLATEHLHIPQPRQTLATLGCQPEGRWGYRYGLNEHQVAAGFATWQSHLPSAQTGLTGTELVRLILERSSRARQAVDVLTDLVGRYGQVGEGNSSADQDDHIFLVADAQEAFVVEATSTHWALQEIRAVRAVSDVGLIRQDWSRISRGLADFVIDRGWWPEDGSKLDFAGTIAADLVGPSSALRRWGRATYLLESQNGHIDRAFLRRLLSDHYEETSFEVEPLDSLHEPVPLCRHPQTREMLTTTSSFFVELSQQPRPLVTAWCAFGSPCLSVYFPIFLIPDGDRLSLRPGASPFCSLRIGRLWQQLHQYVGRDRECGQLVQERLAALQACFEEEAEELLRELSQPLGACSQGEQQHRASCLMQHHLERFENLVLGLLGQESFAGGGTLRRSP